MKSSEHPPSSPAQASAADATNAPSPSDSIELEAPALSGPQTKTELFWAFNRLALQGFGGVLAVAQIELVERKRWLKREDFVAMLSMGQILPGPNVVNLALMVGDRYFGTRGAFTALAGMMAIPLLIILVLTTLYGRLAAYPMVAGALRGMGAVAAGLVIATALKLLAALRRNPLGLPIAATLVTATFVLIALLRMPLVDVIVGLGLLSVAAAWWRLR